MTIGGRTEQKIQDTPDPGAYDVESALKATRPNSFAVKMVKEENKKEKEKEGWHFLFATVTPDNFPVSAFSSHSSRNDVSGSAFGRLRERHPLSLHLRARFFLKKRKKEKRFFEIYSHPYRAKKKCEHFSWSLLL